MSEDKSVQDSGLLSDAALQQWVTGEIHKVIHIERGMTREQLASAANIKASSIDALRKTGEGRRRMTPAQLLSLCCAMGERRVEGLLNQIGFAGARLISEEPETDPRCVLAEILPQLATIATALSDGRIDHREQPSCQSAADEIIRAVLPLSSMGRR